MEIFLVVMWCICLFFNGANMSTSIDKGNYFSAVMWSLCGILWAVCIVLKVAGV